MTIVEIEKPSNEFKKTHKIRVLGPYDDEQVPKWFKSYKEETDKKFEAISKKFKVIDKRFEVIDKKFNDFDKKMPTWFKEFVDHDFKPAIAKLSSRIDNLVQKNNLKE